ncbi:MAG TPA: alpha/beta fold hydrolase [Jatrophihabitans sp.]|nr:alpha/beta fold hydrolase [Jatrophihabitans sp.]
MTEPRRQLITVAQPRAGNEVQAVALVLHGGRDRSMEPVRGNQLAVLRMVPFARRLAADGRLAVLRLRFGVRGWNGTMMSPVADASWALAQLAERYPDRPIGLVGHSMGGRTALRAAGHRQVRSVVGLAPWLPPGEPADQLAGRRVLLAHGDHDRMTSAAATGRFTEQLRAAGIAASYVTVRGEGHAMLRRAKLWHDLTAGFLLGTLLADAGEPGPLSEYLQQAIHGTARVVV